MSTTRRAPYLPGSRKDQRVLRAAYLLRAAAVRGCASCVYCGRTRTDGAVMTLEHIQCYSTHPALRSDPSNLVVACGACNSARGTLPLDTFLGPRRGHPVHGLRGRAYHARRRMERETALAIGPYVRVAEELADTLAASRGAVADVLATLAS